ncbi:NAD(P)-dependent oxidoreductase [Paraburkholderia dipogonis]|uniref:NAD(P)-dependent oxidoreductase n=1 Tax=Paraburkholderia dipogonis TaxID=1211383 RepID=A0A4Y8MHY8_9BURK|nr:NAD(P)-dependent oxidoreductase [Paraburkholderia dipogonis]
MDVRDAAQAIECALRYEARGKDGFFITSDETVMSAPTNELLVQFFHDVERRSSFTGNEVVLSNDKAKRVLGFRPSHHWTDGK